MMETPATKPSRFLPPMEITRMAKIVRQTYRDQDYPTKLAFLDNEIKKAVVCQIVLGIVDSWESTDISSAAAVGIRDEAYLLMGL